MLHNKAVRHDCVPSVVSTVIDSSPAAQSGATLLNLEARRFTPHGVTVLALLAESHASLHSYPEAGALFFDAFTCGPCDPEAILAAVVTALSPGRCERRLLQRGG